MKNLARVMMVGLGVVAALGLTVLAFLPRERSQEEWWWTPGTSFSPGPLGTKALHLLLEREGFEVANLLRLDEQGLGRERTLWLLSHGALGSLERRELQAFLQRGGTVVGFPEAVADLLKEAGLGKPEIQKTSTPVTTAWDLSLDGASSPFAISGAPDPDEVYAEGPEGEPVVASWNIGDGRLVLLGWSGIVLNREIGRAQNGPFLVRLAREMGSQHWFDESKSGLGDANLWTLLNSAPYRWGLLQSALAGLVALAAIGFRRLPPETPPAIRRRSTRSHLEAVAALWSKAHDPGLPLQALVRAADERARVRLKGGGATPFVEWVSRLRPELADRAREAWAAAYRLCSGDGRPSAGEAHRAGAELKRVEEEALRW